MQTFYGISMIMRFASYPQGQCVLASRLCALTIGVPGPEKDQLGALQIVTAILRHKTKYEEQVV